MRCKNCGARIPDNARYCDICGQRNYKVVKREQRLVRAKEWQQQAKQVEAESMKAAADCGKSCLILFAVWIAFMIIISIIFQISDYRNQKEFEKWDAQRDLTGWETIVTPEEYEKLQVGMSYAEIKEIIGGEGKQIDDGDYRYTFAWPGEYYLDKYNGFLEISFDKKNKNSVISDTDIAESIEEKSILGGKEAYETTRLLDEFKWEELDTVIINKEQFSKLEEGMDYEQVCEIFGGQGKLQESNTTDHGYGKSRSFTYVWRSKHESNDTYESITFRDGIIKDLDDWRLEYID